MYGSKVKNRLFIPLLFFLFLVLFFHLFYHFRRHRPCSLGIGNGNQAALTDHGNILQSHADLRKGFDLCLLFFGAEIQRAGDNGQDKDSHPRQRHNIINGRQIGQLIDYFAYAACWNLILLIVFLLIILIFIIVFVLILFLVVLVGFIVLHFRFVLILVVLLRFIIVFVLVLFFILLFPVLIGFLVLVLILLFPVLISFLVLVLILLFPVLIGFLVFILKFILFFLVVLLRFIIPVKVDPFKFSVFCLMPHAFSALFPAPQQPPHICIPSCFHFR